MSFALFLVSLFLVLTLPPLRRLPALRTPRERAAVAAGLFFVVAGALHFAMPATYDRMIPPALHPPRLWTYLSGVLEVAGGAGLLVPRLRRPAAVGLMLVLLAILPANVYVALSSVELQQLPYPRWYFWLRIPFQAFYLVWVAYAGALAPAWLMRRREQSA